MKTILKAALLVTLLPATARAQINAGEQQPEPGLPFTMTQVATFNLPWRIAFLPDGRMLVTEKVGPVWLVTQQGQKTPIDNVPAVLHQGQGGMLGVFVSPHYAKDQSVYLTYAEPNEDRTGSSLALARARLAIGANSASLEGLQVIWRQMPKGRGGQFGAADRVFARRPVPVPDGRRSSAHDARSGSRPGAGEDSSSHARRQARTGKSDGREDRGHKRAADQSAARHGAGQDRARGQHVHVRGTEPDAVRDMVDRSSHAVRSGVRARRPAVGNRARPERRRRAEPDRAQQELRLAARVLRDELQRHADSEPGHTAGFDQAGDLLDARSSGRAISCSTKARCSRSGRARRSSGGWRR